MKQNEPLSCLQGLARSVYAVYCNAIHVAGYLKNPTLLSLEVLTVPKAASTVTCLCLLTVPETQTCTACVVADYTEGSNVTTCQVGTRKGTPKRCCLASGLSRLSHDRPRFQSQWSQAGSLDFWMG